MSATQTTRPIADSEPEHTTSVLSKLHVEPQRDVRDENQARSFCFDDGDDDEMDDEMRRRRLSSERTSASSSSCCTDDIDLPPYVGRRAKAPLSNAKTKRSPRVSEENEWERVSNGAVMPPPYDDSSLPDTDRHDSESDTDEYARRPQQVTKRRNEKAVREEPESPHQQHRRLETHQQQSDDDSDSSEDANDDDDGDIGARGTVNRQSAATKLPRAASVLGMAVRSPLSPPAPKTLAVPVDVSRISKLALFPGSELRLLHGHVVRVKTLLQRQYLFYINDQLILVADKEPRCITPNYRIYDFSRVVAEAWSTSLAAALRTPRSKKSGHYIGKLRADASNRQLVLLANASDCRIELGVIQFASATSATEPRQLRVVLPPLSPTHRAIDGLRIAGEGGGGDDSDRNKAAKPRATTFSLLIDRFERERKGETRRPGSAGAVATSTMLRPPLPRPSLQVFTNKQPVFDSGFYRLNFHGRVSMPSVKNFQLVRAAGSSDDDGTSATAVVTAAAAALTTPQDDDVCLRFGKVNAKTFNLDFRAPLTPIQAFAIALAQFNL